MRRSPSAVSSRVVEGPLLVGCSQERARGLRVVALETEDRPAEEDPLRAEDIRDVPHGDRLVSLRPAKAVKYEAECRGVERSVDREGLHDVGLNSDRMPFLESLRHV